MKIIRSFRFNKRSWSPGDEAELSGCSTPEQRAEWAKKGLVGDGEPGTQSSSGEGSLNLALRDELSALNAQLDDAVEQLESARTAGQELAGRVSVVSKALQLAGYPAESGEDDMAYLERFAANYQPASSNTPVQTTAELSAESLTEIVGAKAAIAILQGGYDTAEKIGAASDDELKALESVGAASVAKLREKYN